MPQADPLLVPDPYNPQPYNAYSGACPERSRRVINNPANYTDPTGMFFWSETSKRQGDEGTLSR
jgi:hypothetical protein